MLKTQIIVLLIIITYGIITFKTDGFKFNLHKITEISFLLVIALILSRLSLMVNLFGFPSLKIGIALVPLILIGLLYGPSYGFIAGLAYDLLGLIITPTDMPFLGFTLVNILNASLPGWISYFKGRIDYKLIKVIVLIISCLFSIVLIGTILIMKDNFFIEMNNIERMGVLITLIVYPFLMYLGLRAFANREDLKQIEINILLSVILVEGFVNLFLTPLWLKIMYGILYLPSFYVRAIKLLVMIPIDIFLLSILYPITKRIKRG